MAYLNLDLDYLDCPKTKKIVGKLGEISIVCHLRILMYTGKYCQDDGILKGLDWQVVEEIAQWKGEKGKLIGTLIFAEYLVKIPKKAGGGYKVIGWLEHNGHLKLFKARAKIAAKARWDPSNPKNISSNASSIDQASDKQCLLHNNLIHNNTVQTKDTRVYQPFLKKEKERLISIAIELFKMQGYREPEKRAKEHVQQQIDQKIRELKMVHGDKWQDHWEEISTEIEETDKAELAQEQSVST